MTSRPSSSRPSSSALAAAFLLVVTCLSAAAPAAAQPVTPAATDTPSGSVGLPDPVRAATLVAPFFQVGVDAAVDPDDTLLVVTNRSPTARSIHYEVWDIDGDTVDIFDTLLVAANDTVSLSMRAVLAAQPGRRAALTDGPYFRGFVTFDGVTGFTDLAPTNAVYPFDDTNAWTGWMYYTRLQDGSANGLPMLHIEHVGDAVDSGLRDIYRVDTDHREEFDLTARRCNAARSRQVAGGVVDCSTEDRDELTEMLFRVFAGGGLNGASRVVVFTWLADAVGGPSVLCDSALFNCPSSYDIDFYDEAGTIYDFGSIRLDHVVNVLEIRPPAAESGFLSIQRIPDVDDNLQLYGFVFNSAQPGDASLNWDAIFEATLVP